VFYGDVCKPEVVKAAGANGATAIIITLDDPKGIEEVVKALHGANTEIDIYARGHDLAQCKRLHEIGATHTVSENLEASLELARLAMARSGLDASNTESVLKNYRQAYREQMHESIK
jgi:voltage-gated potassium channel Kch